MSDDKTFDIPVAVFIFKRLDTLERIFDRLAEVRPSKLYLIADQGRDEAERLAVDKVRRGVDSLITWDCEVVRDYAKENRGYTETSHLARSEYSSGSLLPFSWRTTIYLLCHSSRSVQKC